MLRDEPKSRFLTALEKAGLSSHRDPFHDLVGRTVDHQLTARCRLIGDVDALRVRGVGNPVRVADGAQARPHLEHRRVHHRHL